MRPAEGGPRFNPNIIENGVGNVPQVGGVGPQVIVVVNRPADHEDHQNVGADRKDRSNDQPTRKGLLRVIHAVGYRPQRFHPPVSEDGVNHEGNNGDRGLELRVGRSDKGLEAMNRFGQLEVVGKQDGEGHHDEDNVNGNCEDPTERPDPGDRVHPPRR